MPELPEIANLACQMQNHLPERVITSIEVLQPKCLNLPVEEFRAALSGAQIQNVAHRGKWIVTATSRGWLLINLGMGGEVLLVDRAHLPEKYRMVIDFADGACLAINFWWFGYCHYAAADELSQHAMLSKLGPNALDLDATGLRQRLAGRRGSLKTLLLDQSTLAGIGNSYIHDILFLARLHPLRRAESLSPDEDQALVQAIRKVLQSSLDAGGAAYEMDLHGNKGGFTADNLLVGYREGQPCPRCGNAIQKIKTGSTTGYICSACQSL